MKPSMVCSAAVIALAIGSLAGNASAQTIANGPYYATPSWDQTLPASMNSEAVLDRETGLVWQRSPSSSQYGLAFTIYSCAAATIGGRQGWRLPRADELMSLGDPTNNAAGPPHLPAGHPFLNIAANATYWVIDHTPANFTDTGMVVSFNFFAAGAVLLNDVSFNTNLPGWCVRGGGGASTR
jgi:Protein of unknown function (DUF1566)